MCGIAGVWNSNNPSLTREMMKRLIHRGPDAEGLFQNGGGVLGHRRLSIMDPEGGDQPICDERGTKAIAGNGEIYNFPYLKPELEKHHTFRTRSDTESVLHLYENHGSQCVKHLDGMFAFVLADGDKMFAARDAIGIKPLYFGEQGDSIVIASELKVLAGMAENVKEFPPGAWYHSDSGFHRFYNVPDIPLVERTVEEHCSLLRETLERSVKKRLMSDVPVGAFLSGGLDSSLIAAIMNQHIDDLHTFSVGCEGSEDLAAARVVADYLGTNHHEYIFTKEEVKENLPDIIFHLESFDRDLVRSAIPCYFTSRLAAQHLKVILTGEGADELFGGYTYYKGINCEETLHRELRRSIAAMHNVNLQRVDRLTMAHSLEGRVPFLDTEMIELAQTIPAGLKLVENDKNGEVIEKWVLRKACEDLLPEEIVWRKKLQFDEGSGTADMMTSGLECFLPPEVTEDYKKAHPEANLRCHEEAVYHKLLHDVYDGDPVVMNNVGRWAERPEL
ncbi:MAG: asparagine synthase B [Lentisphaeria bacterium]